MQASFPVGSEWEFVMGEPSRKKPQAANRGTDADRLGSVIEQHGITLAALLFVVLLIAGVGGGVLWYGLSREPRSVLWTFLGGAGVVLAVVFAILNVANLGRRLELRKRGIRYVEASTTTEFLWPDIVEIGVERLDATHVGPVGRISTSSDSITPTGPLTKTEWDVTIHAADGRTIHLRPSFFRVVGDPQKLISHLKLRAGV